jgi:rSAM/selenodomain-associated transferase 1
VLARAPSSGGKSRLAPHLSAPRLTALRHALLADTLTAVASLPDVFVFVTPDEAVSEMETGLPVVPQGGGDLGARMLHALQFLLQGSDPTAAQPRALTPNAAILVGSDIPLLTANHIMEAASTLQTSGGVVLGPADDGGYYLIGMTQVHAGLFEGIAWGGESVLTDTLRAAERVGIDAHLARSAYDVDTIDDLLRLERDLPWLPSGVCPALRRWFSEA